MISSEIWKQTFYTQNRTKWAVLFSSFIIFILIWSFSKRYYDDLAQKRFDTHANTSLKDIQKQFSIYEHVLHASVGYFKSSNTVTRADWHNFVQELNLKNNYPGLQGIGFAVMLKPSEVRNFEQKVRTEDYPSFSIIPPGKREQYSAVLYIEPMDAHNAKAIGYDMFSHPVRRSAMEKARDMGYVSTTKKVTFVQESDSNVQAGIIMYHPVYKIGERIHTIQERRNALTGFAYISLPMNTMMSTILSDDSDVNLKIYDDSKMEEKHLLYRSNTSYDYVSKYQSVEKLNINGQIWHIKVTSTAKFDKDVDDTYALLATAAGLLIYFILVYIVIKISDTKRYIQNRNDQLAFLTTMIDASNDMVFIIRINDGYIEYINKTATKMLGYTLEELRIIGMDGFRRPFNENESFEEHLRNLKQQNEMLDYAMLIRKDGTTFPIEASVRIFNYNGIDYNIAIVRNLTEIRSAEEHIRSSEHFYRTIFSTVHEAIFILDNKIVIDCNLKAFELFKTNKESLVGTSIENPIRKIDCPNYDFNYYLDAAGNGEPIETKASLILYGNTKTAKILHIAMRTFSSNDPKMIIIIRDITKDVEDEKVLKMYSRQAQMSEMISIIAHQWRQPLTVINTISAHTRIQEFMKPDSNMVLIENMTQIEKQILHLSETITDFRDFFIPNKSKELIKFTHIINSAMSLMDHLVKSNEIEIQEITVNDPEFLSYKNEIIHVLMTLLKNSLDAFATNKIKNAKIIMSMDQDPQYAMLSIQDNAGGISPAIIEKVFTPYFTTKIETQGTGLGLYMSKMIIEDNCDGKLEVNSQDEYTTFIIKLPLEKESV